MLPNFLIVGAAKSGTTSLYKYLKQHPDIFMPERKEPCFFVGDPSGLTYQIKKEKYYRKLFATVQNESAIGEASTAYLYDNEAPKRIIEYLGKIKIIILLRNPIEAVYSLYNHEVRREGETLRTFEEALEAEETRRGNPEFKKNCYGWHANYYYFDRGMYYRQVKRYIDMFGRHNMLIFIFEELTGNPVSLAKKAFRFLEVDTAFVPEFKRHNPGGTILDIQRFWTDAGLFQQIFHSIFSGNIIKKALLLLRNACRKPAGPIAETTAQTLRKRFYDDICRLEQLTEKNLSAWK